MKVAERCEGCPRIKHHLDNIQGAEARKAKLAKEASKLMEAAEKVREEITLTHEDLLEGLDEEYRAETEEEIEGISEGDLVEWLISPLRKRGVEVTDEAFELNERLISMEQNCIFILLKGCTDGVRAQQDRTGGEADCGSANTSLAHDHSISFVSSLRQPGQ